MKRLALASAIAVVGMVNASCGSTGPGPIRVGVMLPLTGPDAVGSMAPLDWARQNVNAAGGVGGRPVELVYRDLGRQGAVAAAKAFASDSSIAAVIGPANSEDAGAVTAILADHHKVVVTPSATSADLFRAYAGDRPQYFWRPLESDISQVRTMLDLAVQGGAKSVALVAGDSRYGTTFFNWFGFLATEMGLHVASTVRYDEESEPCGTYISQAVATSPDALLAVPDHADQAICMANQYRASGSTARLIFSDAAEDPSLTGALGAKAQGLEGTGLASDPTSGFDQAFQARFHELPTPYAANTYDSVLLLAYGLERSGGQGGSDLAEAISSVVAGRGPVVGWGEPAVARTLSDIESGRHPFVHGAVGPWQFDKNSGIELVSSTYEQWRIEGSQFVPVDYLSTAGSSTAATGLSAQRSPASLGKTQGVVSGTYEPGPKTGEWALLVAASDGWDNYRHQADVLAQYQLLRANGVPPAHIIVVSANDLAQNSHNPDPGTVRYSVGGPNLDRDVHVDYPLRDMTAEKLTDILSGQVSANTPKVIRSGSGDDVYVFIAGHGNQNGIYIGLGQPVPSPSGEYSILSPNLLDQTVNSMAARHGYRRLLVAVEACEGGVLGQDLKAPGALLISAASPVENSLSANYDPAALTWLSDQFSYKLWTAESMTPDASLDALYQHLYLSTDGSHVSAYGPNFGNAATVSVGEFLTP